MGRIEINPPVDKYVIVHRDDSNYLIPDSIWEKRKDVYSEHPIF